MQWQVVLLFGLGMDLSYIKPQVALGSCLSLSHLDGDVTGQTGSAEPMGVKTCYIGMLSY